MRVSQLEWLLELPWWRGNGRAFAVSPLQVALSPDSYPDQYARTLKADLRRPLHVTPRARRWVVLDGIHRLLKAELQGLDKIRVKRLPQSAYAAIGVQGLTTGHG
jgi:hypothetical protein